MPLTPKLNGLVKLDGLSDEQVIQVAKEIRESGGASESDSLPIENRTDALLALFTLCKVAERFEVKSIFQMEIEANERHLAARVSA